MEGGSREEESKRVETGEGRQEDGIKEAERGEAESWIRVWLGFSRLPPTPLFFSYSPDPYSPVLSCLLQLATDPGVPRANPLLHPCADSHLTQRGESASLSRVKSEGTPGHGSFAQLTRLPRRLGCV